MVGEISLVQCNLDIRNPGYKEQLGYKELFSEFFFYVMGFLAIRNKFGIFPKLKNLDIRNDFQGKCNHFDQYFTETPLRVLFVMICNSCVCCFWWVIHHPPTWHHQKNWQPHLKMGEQPWVFNKKPKLSKIQKSQDSKEVMSWKDMELARLLLVKTLSIRLWF